MSRPKCVKSLVEDQTGTLGIERRIVRLVRGDLRLILSAPGGGSGGGSRRSA